MALSVSAIYELNASATANNANGGGFNPSNANMLSDLTTDTNTANTNSPVVSSASYNFVAGDVGHWLYIKSGTNWTPGWYQIASVASNKATLSAAVGQAVQANNALGNPSPKYSANTVAGCATTGTPTGGVFAIDYSQGTTAIINGSTDFTATGSSTTLTSATGGFTKAMIGNYYHQTTTGTGAFGVVGWYEIVNVTNGNTLTLDRTPNSGTANVACTGYIGGAMSMNSTLDDDFFEIMLATNGSGANRIFVKNGTFTLGETVSISASGGTQAPIVIEGYASIRGDTPTGSTRPIFNAGTAVFALGANWDLFNCQVFGSGTSSLSLASGSRIVNSKVVNTSTTANRAAISIGNGIINSFLFRDELISYRGDGFSFTNSNNTTVNIISNYIHDCDRGLRGVSSSAGCRVIDNIIQGCVTSAISNSTAFTGNALIYGNTLYGAENKIGKGFDVLTTSTSATIINNIICGFVTGLDGVDTNTVYFVDYNDFYNNTTDVDAFQKGSNDIALNPNFTSVSQLTGTGATSSTNVLTYGTGGFNAVVTDGVSHVYISSGSGTGFATGIYPISAHTDTTLTLATPLGTAMNITTSGSGSSIAFQITYGFNFGVGTNMKAVGYPGVFPAGFSTGYTDIGAVQRQEQSGGGSSGFFYS